jgi:hypothetical protein
MTVVHNSPEVKGEGTESSIVGVRQTIDDRVKRITAECIIFVLYIYWLAHAVIHSGSKKHTGSSNEAIMILECK